MKYWIITFGCQMNKSDSERIATVLENKGYRPAQKIDEADLVVVNMCSVRQSAVDRVYGKIKDFAKLKTQNSKLKTTLTGCILKKDRRKFAQYFDYILNVKELPKWPKTLNTKPSKFRDREICRVDNYFKVRSKYFNNFLALVPIMTGCNNFCAYCVVPYTRGREISRPVEEIICEVKNLVKKGFKEIWLLGQNVNSYQYNFPELLRKINKIPGKFWVRFTSSHPKDFSDELIKVMADCRKVAKYLNLPVQSGDDEILKKMNRPYTVAQYKKLVKKIRSKIPNINLSTDVIVGFPGETKKQFENTVKLFKEIKFNIAYISKYSPRPGTAAFQLEDNVTLKEKKRREKVLRDIIEQKNKNKLIVILGPTASGKTDLSIKLAKKFSGEVVSADSRQVYKGMDIGTGKVTKKEMQGIPHELLDVVSPKRRFTVAQYQKLALEAIKKIQKKNKTPFLVGGTGFYIQAVVDGITIPKVKPDWRLRRKLEKKSTLELFEILKKIDPQRSKTIEKKNKRRLIRAIEIARKIGSVPPLSLPCPRFDVLMLGIKKDQKELAKLIKKRLSKRLKIGMIAEVRKLRKSGLSWKRLEGFGLEYRFIAQYLFTLQNFSKKNLGGREKITYEQMLEKIQKESEHFAKRQMTWFKRDERIKWIKTDKEAENLVKNFL